MEASSLEKIPLGFRPYLLLLGVGLLAHGLTLINDGSYIDGWHFNHFLENSQWDKMKRMWYELGRPLGYWYTYIPFKSYYNLTLLKFISFSLIVVSSFFQFALLARFTPLSKSQALFVAVFALLWPYKHWMLWNMPPDQIVLVMFYAGWFIFLNQYNKPKIGWKALSLALVFCSFYYQAFLVYHYVLFLVFFFYTLGYPQRIKWSAVKSRIFPFCKRNLIWGILPFLFFFFKPFFSPTYGISAGFYTVDFFSLKTILFFLGGLVSTLAGPFAAIFSYYLCLPILIALAVSIYFYRTKTNSLFTVPENSGWTYGMMGFGLLLVVAIVFAHAVNGKMAILLSYQGRHSRFAGLGAGLLVLGAVQWIYNKFSFGEKHKLGFVSPLVLICLIYVDINIYLTYQARWAKTQAVVHQLKKKEPLKKVNIYFMRNQLPMGMGVDYHYADVSLVLNQAWGGEKYLGIPPYLQKNRFDRELISIIINTLKSGSNPIPAAREYLKIRHPDLEVAKKMVQDWGKGGLRTGVEHFQPGGCMGEIIVTPKESMYDFVLATRYLFQRTFTPATLEQLYDEIAEVQLRPLNIDHHNNPCP